MYGNFIWSHQSLVNEAKLSHFWVVMFYINYSLQATQKIKEAVKDPAIVPVLCTILASSQNPQVRVSLGKCHVYKSVDGGASYFISWMNIFYCFDSEKWLCRVKRKREKGHFIWGFGNDLIRRL